MLINTAFSEDDFPEEYGVRLGKFLRARRNDLGKSQTVLAIETGMDAAAISRIERGMQRPRMAVLYRFSKVLNVRICDMMAAAEGVSNVASLGKEKELQIAWHLSSLPDEKLNALAVVLGIKFKDEQT